MSDLVTPRYVHIAQSLRSRIAKMSVGDALPSDAALCDEFDVSRMTARHAVQQLVNDGLVLRAAGRGTFVAEPSLHRQATNLITFSSEMRRAGRAPTSVLLSGACVRASQDEVDHLRLRRPVRVVRLHRVRCADGVPIVRELVALRADAADVLQHDLEVGSLHRALTSIGLVPTAGRASIYADAADAVDAETLQIGEGAPLLVERRVIADQFGEPLEYTISRYVSGEYSLEVAFSVDGER